MTKNETLPRMTIRTQEEAISYECANEAITHAMAIVSATIAALDPDDAKVLSDLRAQRGKMADERASLYKLGPDAIMTVRARYGAIVRAHTQQRSAATA